MRLVQQNTQALSTAHTKYGTSADVRRTPTEVSLPANIPNTLQDLIASLNDELKSGRSPEPILATIDAGALYQAIEPLLVHDESKAYTRSAIAITPEFGLLALTWNARAVSAVHDHAGSGCWVKMLRGSLVETRYTHERDGESFRLNKSTKLAAGELSYMDDDLGLHDMRNLSSEVSVSLHCYVPAIEACRVWDRERMDEIKQAVWRGDSASKTMTYDNANTLVQDWFTQ